jgi:hypothetical protein
LTASLFPLASRKFRSKPSFTALPRVHGEEGWRRQWVKAWYCLLTASSSSSSRFFANKLIDINLLSSTIVQQSRLYLCQVFRLRLLCLPYVRLVRGDTRNHIDTCNCISDSRLQSILACL